MKKITSKITVFLVLLICSSKLYSQHNLENSTYAQVIENYFNRNVSQLGLTNNDISDLYITKELYSKSTGITNVYINQRHQGIKVFNAIANISIKNNNVFYATKGFQSNLASKINTVSPLFNAQSAILKVAQSLNLQHQGNLTPVANQGYNYAFQNESLSKEVIPAELVFFTVNNQLRLAWDVTIQTIDGKHWWSIRIDAVTGSILEQNDWILTCNFGDSNHKNHNHYTKKASSLNLYKTNASLAVDGSQYNVFSIPAESPSHGSRSIVSEPADIIASPFGWHDVDGVAGAEFTITRGNNVWAQEDADGNNDVGYSPDGGATLNFDFPLNLDQEPIGYQDAAITNLFYMNNVMHDLWYRYGFDEVSGNFQENNYGNGGAENDFVFADAQDGSGLNNATFGTGPDGSNGGMTMFLWSASGLSEPLTINSGPTDLVGIYAAALPATGEGNNITPPSTTPVTGDLVLTTDFNVTNNDEYDACDLITNGADINGKIAVIRRGSCNFTAKIQNAQNAGAIAVIMVNSNDPSANNCCDAYVNMAGETTPALTIPSIFINNPDGEPIITALENGEVINATIVGGGGPFQKDGDFDNGIIAHEYGHGISIRLTGGANTANCLFNTEQMGEGWSDWFGLMVSIENGDTGADARGIGTYVIGQNTNGGGIRPAPYSTNTAVNGFTYGQIGTQSIPHGVGFVWATMLWDLTWAYIDKYGFDEDFYNGNGGNNKVMQVVMDGLKLQSCNPGFVDGRDAILAAELAITGGEDQCLIWDVFAARGLGYNASQGDSNSTTDGTEDFTIPSLGDPGTNLDNCNSLSTQDIFASNYKIYPNPTTSNITISTSVNFGSVDLIITDINGRVVINKTGVNLFGNTSLDVSQLQSGMYILTINGDSIFVNEKIIKK